MCTILLFLTGPFYKISIEETPCGAASPDRYLTNAHPSRRLLTLRNWLKFGDGSVLSTQFPPGKRRGFLPGPSLLLCLPSSPCVKPFFITKFETVPCRMSFTNPLSLMAGMHSLSPFLILACEPAYVPNSRHPRSQMYTLTHLLFRSS